MQRVQTQKGKHQWKPQQPQVKTGGANYQGFSVAKNTLPATAAQPGWGGGATSNPVGMASFPGQVKSFSAIFLIGQVAEINVCREVRKTYTLVENRFRKC